MEKQSFSVPESIMADWLRRQNVSQHCADLAHELSCYFTGYEDLVRRLFAVSIELEDLANAVLPFDLNSDVL